MLQRGQLPTRLAAAVSYLRSSNWSRRSSKTTQRLEVNKWVAKGESSGDKWSDVIANSAVAFSSTKANGYSELGGKDKQGFIENELVSTSTVEWSCEASLINWATELSTLALIGALNYTKKNNKKRKCCENHGARPNSDTATSPNELIYWRYWKIFEATLMWSNNSSAVSTIR